MTDTKRPAFQFYPGDWLEDMGLRSCSFAAQGLWVGMMCLAHQGTPYGHLRTDSGYVLQAADIARALGGSPREVARLVDELGQRGVYSKAEDGAIFSRRMVRDESFRAMRAAGGQLGGQHGAKAQEHPRASRRGDRRGGGRPQGTPLGTPLQSDAEPPSEPPPPSPSPSPTTEEGATHPSAGGRSAPSRKPARATWLTPYGTAWTDRWGVASVPPWRELSGALQGPIAPEDASTAGCTEQERQAGFVRFLAATERAEWARPARFVQGLGQWLGNGARPAISPAGKPTQGDLTLAAAQRFVARHGGPDAPFLVAKGDS